MASDQARKSYLLIKGVSESPPYCTFSDCPLYQLSLVCPKFRWKATLLLIIEPSKESKCMSLLWRTSKLYIIQLTINSHHPIWNEDIDIYSSTFSSWRSCQFEEFSIPSCVLMGRCIWKKDTGLLKKPESLSSFIKEKII